MAKLRLWDSKLPTSDRVASPSTQAPSRAVSGTPTTADYFNSPLAERKPQNKRGAEEKVDGVKIGGFHPPTTVSSKDSSSDDDETQAFERVQKYKVLKKKQRRRQAMSISVSEEEEDMLRQGAAMEGMTFSAWARKHLFRAMKSKIPRRPNQG